MFQVIFQALALEGDPLIPGDSANVVGGGVRPHVRFHTMQLVSGRHDDRSLLVVNSP